MVSEWESLESWSKEDLIIELVRMRNLYGYLREDLPDTCPYPYMRSKYDPDTGVEGEVTTPEWAERIAQFGASHPKDGWFYSCDLIQYGLDSNQAAEVCDRLYSEGRLKLPEDIKYYVSD